MASFINAPQASAHSDGAYSHDSSTGATYPDWMASLPGNTPLSQLSIPGTHDSGAAHFGGDAVQTQSMDIPTQLNAGIRAFDIRLGNLDGNLDGFCPEKNGFYIFHGIACQYITFKDDVLSPMNTFLAAHPGEAVLMRLKHEHGSEDNFASRVANELSSYSSIMYTGGSSNPTLQEMRGKIVVLQNFTGSISSVTTPISWSSLDLQDYYSVTTNWDLVDKWHDIKNQYIDSDAFANLNTIYGNFLSASGGSLPYFIASGHSSNGTGAPRLATGLTRGVIDTCSPVSDCIDEFPSVDCFAGTCTVAFEGTNIISRDYINASVQWRTGIVFADFPGASLIQAVIDVNSNREATVTMITLPANLVYDGTPKVSTAQTTAGATVVGTPTVTYTGTGSTSYGPSTTAPTNAGTYSASATFDATIDYYGSSDTKAFTIAKAPLTVTANNVTRIYGDPNPAFTASAPGIAPGDTVAGIGITCTTAATPTTPVGTYDITCSGDPANYTVTFVKGTLTIIRANTSTSASNATAIYGDASVTLSATVSSVNSSALTGGTVTFVVRQGFTVRATVTSGSAAGASPSTVSVTLPLDGTWGAGTYTIVATYSGDHNFNPSTSNTAFLQITRRIIWVKPVDRTVRLKQANPSTDPHGDPACPAPSYCIQLTRNSSFAYGQSWSNLNLSVLRFQYARNPPSTNATEYVGKTYRMTAFGVTSGNYDIRYDPGTLTVVP
ncbi:MAG: MBG domain-containing protein [Thermomicrobiales bacterium]